MRMSRLVLAPIALAAASVMAAPVMAAPIGQVKTAKGSAHVLRSGQSIPARVGDSVEEGDSIETGPDGSIGITFHDGTTFAAGPRSTVRIESFRFDSRTVKGSLLARMKRGTLVVEAGEITKGSPDAMKIETPGAILGVRGTRLLISVQAQSTKTGSP